MAHRLFSPVDREQLHARGITEETALAQIALFQHGIPYTILHRPCTVGDGITVLPPHALERLAAVHAAAALRRPHHEVRAGLRRSKSYVQALAVILTAVPVRDYTGDLYQSSAR